MASPIIADASTSTRYRVISRHRQRGAAERKTSKGLVLIHDPDGFVRESSAALYPWLVAELDERDAKVLAIAKEHLFLDTLETRHSDSLDFSDQAVWSLKAALEAAFEAGRQAR